MMRTALRRALGASALTVGLVLAGSGLALAQEPAPTPEPPVAECGFLSAVVCQVPVNIGPIGPFNFNFPGGLFGPPPSASTP